jgi:universal stress protein A
MDTDARSIVVPTDFSETADRALTTAMDMGRALSARVHLVHVYAPVMVLPPPFDMVSLPTMFPNALQKMEEALETRAARVREAGITCEVALLEGNAHVEIVRHADAIGAELIVLGTHGRSGLAQAVLGSVAERVIHRASCPVLVVPERRR